MTHCEIVIGKWNRPSIFERIFKGKKLEFITKENLIGEQHGRK